MGAIGDSISLLRRCPDLAKAIVTAGLLVATLSVGGPLVLAEVKSDVWGEQMSAYSARLNMATGVVSMIFGGAFGRLTDKTGRRRAFALVGLLNFLPWYGILALGANERGLHWYCASVLFSGITCMTPTGCPMIFAFANDVIPAADREVAFGIAYTGAMVIALIAALLGAYVARCFPGEAMPVLVYILVLSIGFFVTLSTVKLHSRVKDAELPDMDLVFCGVDALTDEESDVSDGNPNAPRVVNSTDPKKPLKTKDLEEITDDGGDVSSTDSEFGHKKAPVCSLIAPLRLTIEYAPLRYLCLTTALLCLPEVALGDVTNQFIYAELGLQETHDSSRKQLASMLNTYPGLLASLPAYFLLGVLSKSVGALRLMKWLIPVAAILQVIPMAMWVADYMWFVPIMGISLSLSGVIFTPLQIVNAQIAPEGRVGEAFAGVGVAKQFASVGANLMVTAITPELRSMGVDRPLRYYFPAAGLICLFAYVFAAQIVLPDAPKEEDGSHGRSARVAP